MKVKLKPGLLLCALAIAGLSGCGGAQPQPINVPTVAPTETVVVPTDTIAVPSPTTEALTPTPAAANTPEGDKGGLLVTQADYDAALAKWQAQEITAYTMSLTVEAIEVPQPVLNGDWIVTVSDGGRKVDALSRPQGAPGPDPANSEDLSYLTVEKQFDTIKKWLSEKTPEGTTRRATFDPTLGYPTLVEEKFGSAGGSSTIGGGGGTTVTIHSVEVVSKGPGKLPMPETPIPSSNTP